jgi:branched-chain amino acid transport system ATP-binding protein
VSEPLLRVDGLSKRFGGLVAVHSLSLDVAEGELHALIGPNGAGKTTFISQLAGELQLDEGAVHFDGRDISEWKTPARVRHGLARSFQITQLLPDYSTLDNVAIAVQARSGHSYHFWKDARSIAKFRDEGRSHLDRVGLGARADTPVSEMSHGEQKQLELAIALATAPRMLLLDEPMAGLGTAECTRMIDLLKILKTEVTILLVEHDMDAVFALADRISVLVNGERIATGSADDIRNNDQVRIAYLGEGDA